jgi:hypothetical protein
MAYNILTKLNLNYLIILNMNFNFLELFKFN